MTFILQIEGSQALAEEKRLSLLRWDQDLIYCLLSKYHLCSKILCLLLKQKWSCNGIHMELFAPWRNKSKGAATSRVLLFFNRNHCCHSFIFSFSFQNEIHSSVCRSFTKMNWAKKGQRLIFLENPKRKNVHVISAWLRSWEQCMELWGIPQTTQKQFVTKD